MAMFPLDETNDRSERIAEMFGPDGIDNMVRHAIQFCWRGLPKERRSVDEVEVQIRRMVERALKDFREDRQAFGMADDA